MRWVLPLAFLLLPTTVFAAHVETVIVTATPLSTSAALSSQSFNASDVSRFGTPDLLGALDRGLAGVSLTNAQDNPYQPDLFYRGFEASPLAGDAQGLAVYANGVRLNQAFGDTVSWDLVPDNAVASLDLEDANPVFGLNALGGALALRFKNGFLFDGGDASLSAGSYNHVDGDAEYGLQDGDFSFYAAGHALTDSGWRQFSPSHINQLFTDAGWRSGDTEIHLWLSGADNALTGNGTSPVQLLAAKRNAVFTWPDFTGNEGATGGLTATHKLSDNLTLSAAAYLSVLRQHTLNGDASDLEPCGADLCLEDGTLATDTGGNPIPDFPGGGDYAQLNRTNTSTTSTGATLELAYAAGRLHLTGGAAIDHGVTAFSATSEIGTLTATRGFAGPSTVIDIAGGPIEPVSVTARNTYAGLYATGTLDITDALSATLSARYNDAHLELSDRFGGALSGTHHYDRLNPAASLAYKLTNATLYAGYSEANRAPTPAELSCADAASPCSLTNFFVGDPNLKQVTARTFEAGARGASDLGEGTLHWQTDAWRTDTSNDILLVSSAILGRAFFQNAGHTRRQGIEASVSFELPQWQFGVNYAFTDATFQSPLTLASEDNPHADALGNIHVVPGDHVPGLPQQTLKESVAYTPNDIWSFAASLRAAGGQYLRGDESNLNPKTNPYYVVDVAANWRILDHATLTFAIANLFDRKYETFGAFSPTDDVPLTEAPGASNPRALSPAPPRTIELGLKLGL